ncbi:MAG: hypothetical protein HY401_09595 [Elusimicrobia bacterium]|nr:hypothetical protein [Elusimicrobiota bacterium]
MPKGWSEEFKAKARAFWSERYGRPVSDAEAEDIHRNLAGFFGVLQEWKKEDLDSARPNEVRSQ